MYKTRVLMEGAWCDLVARVSAPGPAKAVTYEIHDKDGQCLFSADLSLSETARVFKRFESPTPPPRHRGGLRPAL